MWCYTFGLWIRPTEELEVRPVTEDDEFILRCALGVGAAFYDCEVLREPGWGVLEVVGGEEDYYVVELNGIVGGVGRGHCGTREVMLKGQDSVLRCFDD